MLEGAEIGGQIFDHPLQQWGNNKLAEADINKINATSFSNQTSRFQPLQMSQNSSSAYKDTNNRSTLKGANNSKETEEKVRHSKQDSKEVVVNEVDEDDDHDTMYEPLTSDQNRMEQRLQHE